MLVFSFFKQEWMYFYAGCLKVLFWIFLFQGQELKKLSSLNKSVVYISVLYIYV